MEIEKKFLVPHIGVLSLDNYKSKEIVQKYISINPVVRIRKIDKQYYLTIKSEGGLEREETEIEIFENQFLELEKCCILNEVRKTRYYIPLENNLIAELDIYHGKLNNLMTVEIEFETVEDAKYFVSPIWFGKDITEDQNYKNHNLCKI